MKSHEAAPGGQEPQSGGALASIHVVDLAGTVATAYCGKLFRDLGAQVTNLEPPGEGHEIRRLPPFHPEAAAPEASGLATYLSLGKRSVAADPDDATSRALLRAADVILDADPGPNRPLEADQIRLSISWFGAEGPYAGRAATDQVISTHIGAVRAVGPAEGPPMLTTGHTPQIVAGTPFRLHRTPAAAGGRAPRLGEHNGIPLESSQSDSALGRRASRPPAPPRDTPADSEPPARSPPVPGGPRCPGSAGCRRRRCGWRHSSGSRRTECRPRRSSRQVRASMRFRF